jgi:uncharacterized membrane protein
VTSTTGAQSDPWDQWLRWLYLGAGLVGLVAAATLLIEKIEILEDPSYVPPCNINPIISCGSVMTTDQAAIFGFPNPIIGVGAFPVVITTAMAIFAGARFARWYWNGLLVGATAGVVLIHWLIFQSLYRIGALCPYCMAVWAVVIPTFWYTALRQARTSPLFAKGRAASLRRAASDYHGVVLTVWYLIIAGLIAKRFWGYWVTLLP